MNGVKPCGEIGAFLISLSISSMSDSTASRSEKLSKKKYSQELSANVVDNIWTFLASYRRRNVPSRNVRSLWILLECQTFQVPR